MATKAMYKRFTGSVWEEYHFTTDWAQLENTPLTLTNIATQGANATTGYLRKTAANTWQLRTAANMISDLSLMTTNTQQDITAIKSFYEGVYFENWAHFYNTVEFEGTSMFQSRAEFNNIVDFTYANVIGLNGGAPSLEKIRTRSTSLTAVNYGINAGSVTLDTGKTINVGDTILMEVSSSSSGTSSKQNLVMFTINRTSTTSTTLAQYVTGFTQSTSSGESNYTFRDYTFIPSRPSSNTISFTGKFLLTGTFSQTSASILWTNVAYTLYVGNIWKVV